jgi:predicted O-linked N-acetylglucosamine transferase (SPINDLY family)
MTEQLLQQAIQHHRAGELSQAKQLYRVILQRQPNHPDANHNLGVIAVAVNKTDLALPFFKLALETNPNQIQFWLSYINALIKIKKFDLADEILAKWLTYGLNSSKIQEVTQDLECNKLVELFNKNRFIEAESLARNLIKNFPENGFAWKTLGTVIKEQGRLFDSINYMQKAVDLLPNDADAHCNLASALIQVGNLSKAEQHCTYALSIQPNYVEALNNLGTILYKNNRFNEAEKYYQRALEINPKYVPSIANLGNIQRDSHYLQEAEASYKRALKINPDHLEVLTNLLFVINFGDSSRKDYLQESKRFGELAAKKVKQCFTNWHRNEQHLERLRIGFVSGDFRNHPVCYFLENLLTQIDNSKIELIAYSCHHETDEVTERIKPYFAKWKPIFDLDDEAAANLIHNDGVHILIDLSGHTAHNRLPVFAWKPAPIQITWLGYFATTGVSEIDYILVDKIGVPEDNQWHFTEKVRYLPNTRLCFSALKFEIDVAPLPALNNGFITFGCFQNLSKVTDDVLELWSKILTQLPTARLRFQSKQLHEKIIVEQLYSRLARYGVEANRVETHAADSYKNYLVAHSQVDFILDTFPYTGGTTTCEALWMGVPTLTLAGETLLARQGASLLSAVGLGNWIATDADNYVVKTVNFTNNIRALSELCASLREQVLNSPLFDAEQFVRNFENALEEMWRDYSIQKGIQNCS